MTERDYAEREEAGGDWDEPYTFGRHPLLYLHAREYARLLIRFPRRDVAARPLEDQRCD